VHAVDEVQYRGAFQPANDYGTLAGRCLLQVDAHAG